MPRFQRASIVAASPEEVRRWHARPGALRRLTPPWEPMRLHHAEGVEPGDRAVLSIGIGPLRRRWVAEHRPLEEDLEEDPAEEGVLGFRDVQVEGPFARWEHAHRFVPAGEGRTRVEDRVEYELPFGPAGRLAAGPVRRRLERAFAYRHRVMAADLAAHAAHAPDGPPRTVAVSGASGLVGSALTAFLRSGGDRVLRLVRREARPGADEVSWDPTAGRVDAEGLEGVDAVVHLAGEPVEGRWTEEKMRRIRHSRVVGTEALARALAGLDDPPEVLVSASAAGYYGDRGEEPLDEESEPGSGFLAGVCRDWEAATAPAAGAGIRVVRPRLGIVLSPAGGALERMLPLFLLGLGGRLGDGEQWVGWIALDDLLYLLGRALRDHRLSGPVNAVAPEPVRNAELARALGRVLSRPTPLPAPAAGLRFLLGQMADEMLLASARVRPAALGRVGHRFRYPEMETALRHVLGRLPPGAAGSAGSPARRDESAGSSGAGGSDA